MTAKRKAGRPSKNDSRRSEILTKAAECFSHNGYNKTTLDQIGEALGFNKAALYYYFKDKEDLFSTVLKFNMTRLWEELKAETTAVEGFEKKMEKYFEIRLNGWLTILKINGISKENLITLNMSFSESILHFRNDEVNFLKQIMLKENTKLSNTDIEELINLMLETQTNITMSGILINDVVHSAKKLEAMKKLKSEVLLHFIKSFQSGYVTSNSAINY